MEILKAGIGDIPYLLGIADACIIDMESKGIFQWNRGIYPSWEVLDEDVRQDCLFMVKHNSRYAALFVLDEVQYPEYEGVKWSIVDGRPLVIHRLAVNPACQGRGIARMILAYAENYALESGYSCIRLDAYSANPGALKLYESGGYRRAGEVYFSHRKLPFYCYEKQIDLLNK